MIDLIDIYKSRLAQLLGVNEKDLPTVKTTCIRENIAAQFPELEIRKSGTIIIIYNSEHTDITGTAKHTHAYQLIN